jgi:hypothetical protein
LRAWLRGFWRHAIGTLGEPMTVVHPRAAFAALVLTTAVAHAQVPDVEVDVEGETTATREDEHRPTNWKLIAIENTAFAAIGASWYWLNAPDQKVDWVLKWDAESWEKKLTTLDALRFDTNIYWTNAFGHTYQAVLGYQINRGNGLGFGGAVLANLLHTLAWEYVVEYREYPSINDMIINTVSGPAVGEPLWQIGRYYRSGPKSKANELAAAVFSPFDAIDDRISKRPWRNASERPFHRFRAWAGGATRDDSAKDMLGLGADLEVMSATRKNTGWNLTSPGTWSRITAEVHFNTFETQGGRFDSRTSIAGTQSRTQASETHEKQLFFGVGTGLTYESMNLGPKRDQLAAYHLVGPQLDANVRYDDLRLELQAAAYFDFGMVTSFSMANMTTPLDPTPPVSSPLVAHQYYFGLGGTTWARVLVDYRRLHTSLEANVHQLWSIDTHEQARGDVQAPRDLVDRRLYTRARIGYAPGPSWLLVEGTFDHSMRLGRIDSMPGMERSASAREVGGRLSVLW